MKRSLFSLAIISACAALSMGCIHHRSTVSRDVERVKVQFENEAAGRIFYEKLSQMPAEEQKESTTKFSLPIVFEYEVKVVGRDNERFNRAVRECDTNKDGMITESEAKIFAGRP